MKPLLHGTGEVPIGIESGFYGNLDDGKSQEIHFKALVPIKKSTIVSISALLNLVWKGFFMTGT
ncbi:MAG: hypothetical protein ACI8YP_002761 [Algoriphagus sp.]|jgi:hypothetical protein|tara:strand:- start:251 stop:442 length:192 start_codon:yes stop_codon:yes gene_type:complete